MISVYQWIFVTKWRYHGEKNGIHERAAFRKKGYLKMEWLERNRKSVIIAVVLVIAFAAGYFFYKSRNAEQGRLILYGNVDIRQISLAFNSNGRIEEMLKEEGDAVKAGDVLRKIMPALIISVWHRFLLTVR